MNESAAREKKEQSSKAGKGRCRGGRARVRRGDAPGERSRARGRRRAFPARTSWRSGYSMAPVTGIESASNPVVREIARALEDRTHFLLEGEKPILEAVAAGRPGGVESKGGPPDRNAVLSGSPGAAS